MSQHSISSSNKGSPQYKQHICIKAAKRVSRQNSLTSQKFSSNVNEQETSEFQIKFQVKDCKVGNNQQTSENLRYSSYLQDYSHETVKSCFQQPQQPMLQENNCSPEQQGTVKVTDTSQFKLRINKKFLDMEEYEEINEDDVSLQEVTEHNFKKNSTAKLPTSLIANKKKLTAKKQSIGDSVKPNPRCQYGYTSSFPKRLSTVGCISDTAGPADQNQKTNPFGQLQILLSQSSDDQSQDFLAQKYLDQKIDDSLTFEVKIDQLNQPDQTMMSPFQMLNGGNKPDVIDQQKKQGWRSKTHQQETPIFNQKHKKQKSNKRDKKMESQQQRGEASVLIEDEDLLKSTVDCTTKVSKSTLNQVSTAQKQNIPSGSSVDNQQITDFECMGDPIETDQQNPIQTLTETNQVNDAMQDYQNQEQLETEEEDSRLKDNFSAFLNMGRLQAMYGNRSSTGQQDDPSFIHTKCSPIALPKDPSKKWLLLLDMDETLLHAATLNDIYCEEAYGPQAEPNIITSFQDRHQMIDIGVFLRPYLYELLQKVAPYFTIAIYTASEQVYANAILDQIDPSGELFQARIYRNHCLNVNIEEDSNKTAYIKDLGCISNYSLEEILLVDNSLMSFALQADNGIPISSYFWDPQDQELLCLTNFLLENIVSANVTDVRQVNIQEFKLQRIVDLSMQTQILQEEKKNQDKQYSHTDQSSAEQFDSEYYEEQKDTQSECDSDQSAYDKHINRLKLEHRVKKQQLQNAQLIDVTPEKLRETVDEVEEALETTAKNKPRRLDLTQLHQQ